MMLTAPHKPHYVRRLTFRTLAFTAFVGFMGGLFTSYLYHSHRAVNEVLQMGSIDPMAAGRMVAPPRAEKGESPPPPPPEQWHPLPGNDVSALHQHQQQQLVEQQQQEQQAQEPQSNPKVEQQKALQRQAAIRSWQQRQHSGKAALQEKQQQQQLGGQAVNGLTDASVGDSLSNGGGAAAPGRVGTLEQVLKVNRHLPGNTVHTLYTSNGSPYQNIQGRIMYATYRMAQEMPGGEVLTGFTRILHRTTYDDPVAKEIPTFRADPLQPACDTWCEFPVADRANAVAQWLAAVLKDPSMLKGAWVLMLETDYVWRMPVQLPGSAWDTSLPGEAFRYGYIVPQYPMVVPILQAMCPTCNIPALQQSGPAPVLMRLADLWKATPDWERYTAWIESHDDAKTVLGWVREMYAWDVAVHLNNITLVTQEPPSSCLISQPPADHSPGAAAIYHYTWGTVIKKGGQEVWHFDKRDYTAADLALKMPTFKLPPPFEEGWTLQDGVVVTRDMHATLTDMLTLMNTAVARLPDLRPGSGGGGGGAV